MTASRIYPVPQNAPHVGAGINVPNFPEGQRPKARDVSPWDGVYFSYKGTAYLAIWHRLQVSKVTPHAILLL